MRKRPRWSRARVMSSCSWPRTTLTTWPWPVSSSSTHTMIGASYRTHLRMLDLRMVWHRAMGWAPRLTPIRVMAPAAGSEAGCGVCAGAWTPALDADGQVRDGADLAETHRPARPDL